MAVTRFSPTPDAFAHLGHAYCALRNDAAGDGVWLIFEDVAARLNHKPWVLPGRIEESMRDFEEQLPRFGIRVLGSIVQSQRLVQLEEINRRCFGGRKSWMAPPWTVEIVGKELSALPGMGYISSGMNHLGQVVFDHELGVQHIYRGEELYVHRSVYIQTWDDLCGGEPEWTRPYLHYIPEVCELTFRDELGTQKLSKSMTRVYSLRDLDGDPLAIMRGIVDHQMKETPMSGPLKDVESFDALRQWVATADTRRDPEAITMEEVESWS